MENDNVNWVPCPRCNENPVDKDDVEAGYRCADCEAEKHAMEKND